MMTGYSIDLNADVGEGINNEDELLPLLSSCNIACGGHHAGNEETMRHVIQLALQNKVKIGAHPSYPDKKNFGRQTVSMSCSALFSSVKGQIKTLMKAAYKEHAQLHHVKPHGALYNEAARNATVAEVILEVMRGIQLPLKLYVPYGSVIAKMAKLEGVPITYEVFADRTYNDDLTLVSRKEEHAVITSPELMFDHVYRMVVNRKVQTVSGIEKDIKAETFCIHGDNPNAVILATELKERLLKAGIVIQ